MRSLCYETKDRFKKIFYFDPLLQGHKYILRRLLQSTYDMQTLWRIWTPSLKINEEDICISSNFKGFKYVWPWPLTTRSCQLSEIFILVYTSYSICVLNINTPHWYTKEEFVLWAVWQFLRVTLALDFKVISIFWSLCCNFHMICNYCKKYEYARSKKERCVRVLSPRQVLSISDLYLWLQGHINYLKHTF